MFVLKQKSLCVCVYCVLYKGERNNRLSLLLLLLTENTSNKQQLTVLLFPPPCTDVSISESAHTPMYTDTRRYTRRTMNTNPSIFLLIDCILFNVTLHCSHSSLLTHTHTHASRLYTDIHSVGRESGQRSHLVAFLHVVLSCPLRCWSTGDSIRQTNSTL